MPLCRKSRTTFNRICLLVSAFAAAGDAGGRTFVDSVRPPQEMTPIAGSGWKVVRPSLTRAENAAAMNFRISLRMRDPDGLRTRIRAGEKISPADMDAHYLPLRADYQRLLSWCRQVGFEVTMEDRNHTTAYLRASVGRIGSVMGAQFSRVGNGADEFSSAVTPPSLPDAIAGPVLSVSGLQPERTPVRVRGTHLRPQIIQSAGVSYVTPPDVATAYDFPAGLDGSGETIAFVEDSTASLSEFSTFWQTVGLPSDTSRVSIIRPDQVTLPNQTADDPEAALDVEWAGSLAPAAKLRVYVDADLFVAMGAVLNDAPSVPGMNTLSFSYGGEESQVYDPSYSQTLLQLQAAGVAVIVASGEKSNIPGQTGQTGVDYPASDPSVTSVGGTSITFNPDGSYGTDQWLDYSGTFSGYDGTGYIEGGYTVTSIVGPSSLFDIPSWQSSAIAAAMQADPQVFNGAGTKREVPDVAAFALGNINGNPAYALDYDVNGEDAVFGTSVSAPIWSAVVALLDEKRAHLGKAPIAALNPVLYPAFTLASQNLPPPLSMPNLYNPAPVSGLPPETVNYEYLVGLGRPDVSELILCLGDEFYSYCDQWATALPAGGTAVLTAHAVGGQAQFQWQVDAGSGWTNLSEGENSSLFSGYMGTQTPALTIVAQAGYPGTYRYRALATNASGAVAPTGPVPVEVVPLPTTTVVDGIPGGPVQPYSPVSLQVNTTSSRGVTYRWELNGQTLSVGGNPEYSFNAGTASQGYYSVVVSDSVFPALSVTLNLGYLSVTEPDRIYHVTVLAGGNANGFQDGTGSAAEFQSPAGVALDPQGNVIVADSGNNAIRRVTLAGVTTTVAGGGRAGNADGVGAAAQFNRPTAVAVDAQGIIYVADTGNSRIRRIAQDGTVTTLAGSASGYADGPALAAMFSSPTGIVMSAAGTLYISDSALAVVGAATEEVARIRTLTPSGQVETLATIPGGSPGIAVDASGMVYVDDPYTIHRVAPDGTMTSVISSQGNQVGPNDVNTFEQLYFLAIDPSGRLYFSDFNGIRQLPPAGSPENLITDTGQAIYYLEAGIMPEGLAADGSGDVYYSLESGIYTPLGEVVAANCVAAITKAAPATAVAAGSEVELSINVATSAGPSTFQWQRDGINLPGATGPTLVLGQAGPADRGDYTVVWNSPAGSSTLGAGTLAVSDSDAKIVNLSARATVGLQANSLITGFVVAGDAGAAPKQALLTGRGPFLQQFGISNYLAVPETTLYDGQSRPIASELSWGDPPSLATGSGASPLATTATAFEASPSVVQEITGGPLPTGSADAVMLCSLPAGLYTNAVTSANGATGVALAEIFDADSLEAAAADPSRLVNVSARAFVGSGDQVLVAGFIVGGGPSGQPETVMIRAQGPNLAKYGLLGLMDQTRITLYDNGSAPIASNAGWSNPPVYASGAGASALAVSGVGLELASAPLQLEYASNTLDAGSQDSALIVTLPPGSYTAALDNPDGSAGVGLIEVFEIR